MRLTAVINIAPDGSRCRPRLAHFDLSFRPRLSCPYDRLAQKKRHPTPAETGEEVSRGRRMRHERSVFGVQTASRPSLPVERVHNVAAGDGPPSWMFGESPGVGDLLINITGESPGAASMGERADGNRSRPIFPPRFTPTLPPWPGPGMRNKVVRYRDHSFAYGRRLKSCPALASSSLS